MKSIKKKIIASALAVTLLGGAFMPKANAAPVIPTETNEKIWKDLKITKILNKVEKGVTTPDTEFEFSFTPKTVDAPAIENVKIGYTAADNTDADDTEAGIQVEKTVGVDLSKIQWTKSGIYEYKLEEVIPDPGIKDMDYGYLLNVQNRYLKPGQKDYSPYKITFKVEEINGKLEVTGITVSNRAGKIERKLNYDDKKGLKFKNYYNKKDGNTPQPGGGTDITEADKKGFAFKKIVDSEKDYDLEKSFDFTIKADKAVGSNSKDTEFKYVVVDKDGIVGGEQTAAYGTEFTVSLKNNQRVVFTDVILGSKVSVTEKDSKGLTPSIESNFFEKDDASSSDKTVVGYIGDQEGGNFAEFTNKNTPLTGILIDNLPYIALVVVAGFGIFFFVKNRKEEEIYA
ncbi:MAG: hypothetical protein E7K18_03350 [Anaerococcus vaginalis]|uniref:Spy0128 family protein n=1 Tax=Anaerococcus vaginalis TaxID=33037 RepID=UPI0029155A4C|nr:FctA domain-containing protein [Anaerococcus vaginalis]MDU7650003.1 hypothetical protein [Anaerococcus vaginalis]